MKAKTDAITLETFTDQLLDVQFCDNTPIEAELARQEVRDILLNDETPVKNERS